MINAIMSLTVTYRLPLPILASWRGVYEETIEAQVPFGKALPKLLDALDLNYTIIEDAPQIGLVEDVIHDAFGNERPHIALISPRTWGREPNTTYYYKYSKSRGKNLPCRKLWVSDGVGYGSVS
jgi:sulfopyruvate decarboxylase TPP-binding subunit